MSNPVLVEIVRGGRIDLRHRGAVAVSDAQGDIVFSVGDVDRPVYPRSAAKLLQALPLIESGAADRYGLSDAQLALACASHSSEDGHLVEVEKMLAAAGLSETDLECGAHWPLHSRSQFIEFVRAGRTPTDLHNTCSGKHAGFLCAACHQEIATGGYGGVDHEIQRQIRAAQEDLTGYEPGDDDWAMDGCSIPTFAFPLRALARGFARVATGEAIAPARARAARRLMEACMAHPWYTAGTDRLCTRLIEAGQRAIYAKFGADGVYVASLPEHGLGVALKCDDGSEAVAGIMLVDVLLRLLTDDDALRARLQPMAEKTLTNWNGIEVSVMRPASA